MEQFNYVYSRDNNSLFLKQNIYRVGSYHYNWHKYMELLVIMSGEVEVCTNGITRVLETDDVILINSNTGHATLAQNPNSILMLIHVDPIFLNNYYDNTELLEFDVISSRETRNMTPFVLIRAIISKMALCINKNEPEQKVLFESLFYSLIHTIILYFPPKENQSAAYKKNQTKLTAIDKMIKYIDKNYKKKITLENLAKESGYNSNYVSQLFKTNIGINFHEYLTRIRLREATRGLSQKEYKILDIALENGFSDIKSLNSAFKKNFGKSPTEYRKKLNNEITQIDINFKKQFVSVDNTLVNNKLNEYIALKESSYSNLGVKESFNGVEKTNNLTKQIVQLLDKFKEFSGEIDQAITHIEDYIDDKF